MTEVSATGGEIYKLTKRFHREINKVPKYRIFKRLFIIESFIEDLFMCVAIGINKFDKLYQIDEEDD